MRLPEPRQWRPEMVSGAVVFGVIGVLCAALVCLPSSWMVRAGLLAAMGVGTVAAMLVGLRANAPVRRGPWETLLLGAVVLGLVGWVRVDRHTFGHLAATSPLGPELGQLVGLGLVALAVSVFARAPHPFEHRNPDTVIDGALAGLAAYVVCWAYVVEPTGALSTVQRAMLPLPVSIDVFMLVVAMVGIVPRIRRSGSGRALLCVLGALAIGDFLYLGDDLRRFAVPLGVVGAAYVAAAGALGFAFLHPSMRRLFGGRLGTAEQSPGRARLSLVVLVPAALVVVGLSALHTRDQRALLGAALAGTFVLVVVRVLRAVSSTRASVASLEHQARHDPLTGLGNRALIQQAIDAALSRSSQRTQVAVIFLDLDRFKTVNDIHGYSCGDQLLAEVGQRLVSTFSDRAVVARVGGDEFALLVHPVATTGAARHEAERARRLLRTPFHIYNTEIMVTASVGVVVSSGAEPTTDAETMLRDADTAMYQAKAAGRDAVSVFDPSMRDRLADRLALEHDLRLALEREEFVVMFQPIVSLGDEATIVVGLEALLRWDRPTRGLVPASLFVECAEASGLLREIGDWVIGESARHLAKWRRVAGGENLFVSVNVSALHLRSPSLADGVRVALAETGLEPSALCIEVSESTLMEDTALGVALVIRLKQMGVRLAVDDFGRGYGSLAYLKQFPVDYVKVDPQFIEALVVEDGAHETLVGAIVSMASSIGAICVAEGVETERQERALRGIGCELAQGFFYSWPVPADEVMPTVRAFSPRRGLRLVTGDAGGGRPAR
jgi:diguanylate cyclase